MAVSTIIFVTGANGYYDLRDADDTLSDMSKALVSNTGRWTIRWSKTEAAGALNGTIFTHARTYKDLPTALKRFAQLVKQKDKYVWTA